MMDGKFRHYWSIRGRDFFCMGSSIVSITRWWQLKWVVGISVSYWDGLFSGAMLVKFQILFIFAPDPWGNDPICWATHIFQRDWSHLGDNMDNNTWILRGCWCLWCLLKKQQLGGGFKHFLFSPLFGEDSYLTNIFQRGWNHQLDKVLYTMHVYRPHDHVSWLRRPKPICHVR